MPRACALLLLAPLILAVAGCQSSRETEQELVDLRNETTLQLLLLNRHGDFLSQKSDLVAERLRILEEADLELARNFDAYASRPDEVKEEVLGEVDSRGESMANQQQAFAAEIDQRLHDKERALDAKTKDAMAAIQAVLDYENAFFRFVFTEQDSLNLVFARRFEDRPWYESVLSRWEARQSPTP
jgi:hypothetical protein